MPSVVTTWTSQSSTNLDGTSVFEAINVAIDDMGRVVATGPAVEPEANEEEPTRTRKPLTKAKWKRNYGELRKLLNNPELRQSGGFLRLYDDHQEYIYNSRSNRVIAYYGPSLLRVQPNSYYRQLLVDRLSRPEIQNINTQPSHVRRVGAYLMKKGKNEKTTTPSGSDSRRRNKGIVGQGDC